MADHAVRVGTRGSRLALWQADQVVERLTALRPGLTVERVIVRTVGDAVLDTALSKIGDKGLFTKELEQPLLDGAIDLAVHSLKDLPTRLPEGLGLGAVLPRGDPRDVLVSTSGKGLAELPTGARIGTSSLRRRSQVLAFRPDLRVLDLRGNVPTRIEKVERGEYDAAVLARAGLLRLDLAAKITETLEPHLVLPAVGQGAIAVEVRAGDDRAAGLVAGLDHGPTRLAVTAERALLARLEGGCQVPIGALATLEGKLLVLSGLVADVDGRQVVRWTEAAVVEDEASARALGGRVAERLLKRGAREILAGITAAARSATGAALLGEDD